MMSRTIEWALYLDTTGVDYYKVMKALKEKLSFDEYSRRITLATADAEVIPVNDVRFSYRKTSMHIKVFFAGLINDYQESYVAEIFSKMKEVVESIDEDVPELKDGKRSMKLKIDDLMVERHEFEHMTNVIRTSKNDPKKKMNAALSALSIICGVLLVLWLAIGGKVMLTGFIICFIAAVVSLTIRMLCLEKKNE